MPTGTQRRTGRLSPSSSIDRICRAVYRACDEARILRSRLKYRRAPAWCRRLAFSPQQAWEPLLRKAFSHWKVELAFAELRSLDLRDFDLVVPLNTEDALWLAEHRSLLEHNAIPAPPVEVIDLCDDKRRFFEFLESNGFSAHVPPRHDGLTYPFVLKRRRDHSSLSVRIIRGRHDADACRDLLGDDGYFTQGLVRGCHEYVTHINFRRNQVVSELSIQYTFEGDDGIKFRSPVRLVRYIRCPDLALLVRMLRALRYEGLCCANYKVSGGKVVMLEINPRFGGSLCPLFFEFVGQASAPASIGSSAPRCRAERS